LGDVWDTPKSRSPRTLPAQFHGEKHIYPARNESLRRNGHDARSFATPEVLCCSAARARRRTSAPRRWAAFRHIGRQLPAGEDRHPSAVTREGVCIASYHKAKKSCSGTIDNGGGGRTGCAIERPVMIRLLTAYVRRAAACLLSGVALEFPPAASRLSLS